MRRRYTVEGEVQGVGFRHFTRRHALRLCVVGWVRNLPTGRVEALAEGTPEQLAEFEASLRSGPGSASVTNLQILDISNEIERLTTFEIR